MLWILLPCEKAASSVHAAYWNSYHGCFVKKKPNQNLLNWLACDSANAMPAVHRLRHIFLTTGRVPCVYCDAFHWLSEMCIWSMWNLSTTTGDISIYLPHSQSSFKHSDPFIPPSIKWSLLSIYKTCKFRESPMKKPSPAGNSPTFHWFINKFTTAVPKL